MSLTLDVRKYFERIGRKGGKAKSERKASSSRANAQRPRPGRRKKTSTIPKTA